jgi:hypothetical protein
MTVIGVTGHRVLMEIDKIEQGIDAGIMAIQQHFPNKALTIVSALAEGADRLVAHRVLSHPGARLIAILPLERERYLLDFETESSRAEFDQLLRRAAEIVRLPGTESREQAYAAAGLAMLDQAEVVMAVWDGNGAQGQAGTGEIVSRARQAQTPLVWVHAGNRAPGTLEPTSLGSEQGRVTFENWPLKRGSLER